MILFDEGPEQWTMENATCVFSMQGSRLTAATSGHGRCAATSCRDALFKNTYFTATLAVPLFCWITHEYVGLEAEFNCSDQGQWSNLDEKLYISVGILHLIRQVTPSQIQLTNTNKHGTNMYRISSSCSTVRKCRTVVLAQDVSDR